MTGPKRPWWSGGHTAGESFYSSGCASNGMLVYAWLDPPQVSEKFWTEHPEWQELNYKGEAVRPSWRYPMALTSPACMAAVKGIFKEFLEKYDWDGVNLAELYFESG